MKSKYILLLFVLFSGSLSAQNERSRFFIETGVKAFGGGDYQSYIGKTGISFNKSSWATYNDNDGSLSQEGSNNSFSWSIAPRIGYRLGNRIKAGIEYQYFHSSWNNAYIYKNSSSGVFIRLDFNDKKIVPFIELASGFGGTKEEYESTSSGGGQYQKITKLKLFYLSGSVGVSFVLPGNFNLNLLGRVHNTYATKIDDNNGGSISYVTNKYQELEIVPMLSVTYFFNKKSAN